MMHLNIISVSAYHEKLTFVLFLRQSWISFLDWCQSFYLYLQPSLMMAILTIYLYLQSSLMMHLNIVFVSAYHEKLTFVLLFKQSWVSFPDWCQNFYLYLQSSLMMAILTIYLYL